MGRTNPMERTGVTLLQLMSEINFINKLHAKYGECKVCSKNEDRISSKFDQSDIEKFEKGYFPLRRWEMEKLSISLCYLFSCLSLTIVEKDDTAI